MPTVSVGRDRLFQAIGQTYSNHSRSRHFPSPLPILSFSLQQFLDAISIFLIAAQEEFEALCFEFGIELDDVVTFLLLPFFSPRHLRVHILSISFLGV